MSAIEFSQLTTQNNTQETPIKMSSQAFAPSAAFLKAVEKEMKSYVTALSKAGALNCSVKVAMEALLSGREIEKPVKKVKAKKPKISDEEKAAKKEAALKVKIDQDPSSQMAEMRGKLESLQRNLTLEAGESAPKKEKKMTPQDLIDAVSEE